jgi:alpha-beta hydrolase superfamily lysophospholipase
MSGPVSAPTAGEDAMRAYTEELVYTTSEDGRLLEGAVIAPAGGAAHPLAALWVHGLTGRFYSPTTVNIGRALATDGITLVTGNNRGHDFGAIYRDPTGAPILGGGAWEFFEEAPRDIAAWIGFVVGRGFAGVALLGHSLGALKVAAYQAERQDPRVRGLIAASPPTGAGRLRPELVAQAERMVAEGRGRDLLPWGISPAGGGTVSAQTYLGRARVNVDTYGFHTPEPAIGRVTCPLLAFYGTDEAWVGTPDDLATIERNAGAAASVRTRVIDGSDHSYTGCESVVAGLIAEWVATLAVEPGARD